MSISGLIPGHLPIVTDINKLELLRYDKMIMDIGWYYKTGIQKVIKSQAEKLRKDLVATAPYDAQEIWGYEQGMWQNYHMQDHMTSQPIPDGMEVESEASYSGKLEYGTAYHGVQYIFFRPATEKVWKAYKLEVVNDMKRIVR
jgi:hypothetical protein